MSSLFLSALKVKLFVLITDFVNVRKHPAPYTKVKYVVKPPNDATNVFTNKGLCLLTNVTK